MSYELFIDGRPVGQIASIGGMADMTKAFRNLSNELGIFLKKGISEKPDHLKWAIDSALQDAKTQEFTKDCLRAIKELLPEQGAVSISCE